MTKPVAHALTASDADFYLPAARFFAANLPSALTYDDVSLATLHSEILPKDTDLATNLAEGLRLQIPIISSDMETVTESRMAIAMALNGGLGLIHYNLPGKDQIKEVARVKHHIHGLIQDPMTVLPEATIGDVLSMIDQKRFDLVKMRRVRRVVIVAKHATRRKNTNGRLFCFHRADLNGTGVRAQHMRLVDVKGVLHIA